MAGATARTCGLAVACLSAGLAAAPAAVAHPADPAPLSATALGDEGCPGAAIEPARVIEGEFGTELEGGYVLLPFDVPAGTTSVRVKYCYDQPGSPTSARIRHTLDLGLYEARRRPGKLYDAAEFRGWGGSSHPDVTVSPLGFSSEEQYREDPKGHVPGRTTRGFRPGPVRPGEWAVELGVAAVVPPELGDLDGKVAWRVEIELSRDREQAKEPYRPAPYDDRPARREPGWYAGDFHVHAEHSSLGDATMRETFDYAFRPLAEGGAGLDFITLSDYVTDTGWGEIGRHQGRYPDSLIVRSAEVITYRGHINNHGSATYVDYRTGPVYERAEDGAVAKRRDARPASAVADDIRAARGLAQINHPTIFPAEVPGFGIICRGCSWSYSAEETGYERFGAIEVATGPAGTKPPVEVGPNPFTPLAIDFYERALGAGHRIAAVGSSDSHNAGRTPDPVTQAPIGQATTVVRADELSECGVLRGVAAGHTYVKVYGNDGPDVRLEARATGSDAPPAIMGDTLDADEATFTARVMLPPAGLRRPGPYQLLAVKDGVPIAAVPVTAEDFTHSFSSQGPGRYRLQVQRASTIEAVSSPIYLRPGASAAGAPPVFSSSSRRR